MAMRRVSPLQSCGLLLALSAPGLFAQQIPRAPDAVDAQTDPAITTTPLSKRPAEMMPNAPKVSCQEGQLAIQAENSSLRSILAVVHSCLGIEIELPEAFADSRAYLQLGPGPAREVLDALLRSTDLNYVIQSSSTEPSKVATVLLMARLTDVKDAREPVTSPGFAMTPARRAWAESRRNVRPSQPLAEETPAVEPEPTEPLVEAQEKAAATPPDLPALATVIPSVSDATQPATASEKTAADASSAAEASAAASPAAPATASNPSQEASPDAPAKKVLDGKIGAMEQLFEQRKQMIASPPAAADPR